MKIRRYREGDLTDIVKINIGCWKTNYKGIINQEYLDNISYENKLKNRKGPPKGTILVAEDKGKVVGFIHGNKSRNEKINIDNEIYAIYVDTNSQ